MFLGKRGLVLYIDCLDFLRVGSGFSDTRHQTCWLAKACNHLRLLSCVQVAVEDIIADGRLRLAVTPVLDESQLAAALQVCSPLLPLSPFFPFTPQPSAPSF